MHSEARLPADSQGTAFCWAGELPLLLSFLVSALGFLCSVGNRIRPHGPIQQRCPGCSTASGHDDLPGLQGGYLSKGQFLPEVRQGCEAPWPHRAESDPLGYGDHLRDRNNSGGHLSSHPLGAAQTLAAQNSNGNSNEADREAVGKGPKWQPWRPSEGRR